MDDTTATPEGWWYPAGQGRGGRGHDGQHDGDPSWHPPIGDPPVEAPSSPWSEAPGFTPGLVAGDGSNKASKWTSSLVSCL